MKALATSESLSELSELALSRCEVGPEGAAALASATFAEGLTWLALDNNPLTNAGLAPLLAGAGFPRLLALKLEHAGIGADGIEALVETDRLPTLRELNVYGNGGTPRTIRALRERYRNVPERGERELPSLFGEDG